MDRQDQARIDVESERDISYWAGTFGVSIDELRAAVAEVGPMVKDVRDNLLL